jgi:hypothetical protein
MLGELRWTFEGDEPGSIVATRETSSTRRRRPGTRRNSGAKRAELPLTSSTYPSANHFYDPRVVDSISHRYLVICALGAMNNMTQMT